MYTQCPDCSTAFRVTAEVLKQAAGKVRCGGCGNAFNALDYLSEQKPEPAVAKQPDPSLPELTPEVTDEDEKLPKSISAEQSAALLKTLDELAGSDIRIEDTGVEWRVMEDEEDDSGVGDVVDTREPSLDEILEDSPTPVDQFLTATPNDVDAAEVFEESANGPGRTPVDELRFDDNTPLPDDFDLDDESSYLPETVTEPEPPSEPEPIEEKEEPQGDLDLSEPDEWEDILDEFEDMRGDSGPAPLEAELAALESDQREPQTEPEEVATDEEPGSISSNQELLDMDTQFALQAEAMGIDLTGTQKNLQLDDDVPDAIEPEPADEADVAVEETAEAVVDDEVVEDADLIDLVEEGEDGAPLEFGAVEEELAELEEQSDVFDSSFFVAADEVAAEIEEESLQLDDPGDDLELEEPQPAESSDDEVEALELADEVEPEADAEVEDAVELEADIELEDDIDLEAQPDLKEELELSAEPYPEDELALEEPAAAEDDASGDAVGEHVVPELTEEEQTINMMIDQDLMSLAIEDEDGFASTIIVPEKDDKKKDKKRKKDKKDKKARKKDKQEAIDATHPFDETGSGFETIIMEGEHVLSEEDKSKLEAHAAEAAKLVAASKAEEAAMETAGRGKRLRMIGGAIVLLLVLVVQVLHQSREALATYPLFNDLVGPVYRAIGKPLSPAWDITGWRIEATKGSIEDNDEKLVVYSRIGNKSDKPLPYPIINISLTDRFEETLGSRQLDPAEYLPDSLDPSELVQPGNNFNAVISIQSPSADASGYELDVCYRVSAGQLRCAIADFK